MTNLTPDQRRKLEAALAERIYGVEIVWQLAWQSLDDPNDWFFAEEFPERQARPHAKSMATFQDGDGVWCVVRPYTESIVDAMGLLEADGCLWDLEKPGEPGEAAYLCSIVNSDGEWICGRSQHSPALAICLALAAKHDISIEEEPE